MLIRDRGKLGCVGSYHSMVKFPITLNCTKKASLIVIKKPMIISIITRTVHSKVKLIFLACE